MRWKPIETAPKDGTEILAWNGESVQQSWWDDTVYRQGKWCIWRDAKLGHIYWLDPVPTHWMPLPLPPQEGK